MNPNNRPLQLGVFLLVVGFWLLPFWTGRTFVSFTGQPEGLPTASVLSAESSRLGGQVQYLASRSFIGSTEQVIVYAYPGRITSYSGIYQVRNDTSRTVLTVVKEVQVSIRPELDLTVAAYFGSNEKLQAVTLAPGQSMPLNLKIFAPLSFPQPLPVEVTFTLVSS